MTVDGKTIQAIIAYASIVMGVLTSQLSGIHLPPLASAILGIFGVLLHPDTSVNALPKPPTAAPTSVIGTPPAS